MADPSEAADGTARPSTPMVPIFLALVALTLMGAWLMLRDGGRKLNDAPLPMIAQVPAFSLTERSGQTLTNGDLLGKVWVVDFVFTSCAGPCPEMSMRMRSLQDTLKETGRDVTLVSVTVDPETDRPKVLRRYAKKYRADGNRWLFLTGDDESQVRTLVLKGFLQAVSPATEENPIIHSTRFVMVGRRGYLRGFHDGLDVSQRDQLLHDLDKLLAESADAD